MVGLFEWRGGPDELKPKFDKLVVKQLRDDKPQSDSLGNEAEHYTNMNKAKSPHIVRMLHEAQRVISGADENLGAEWDGKVRRLFLEYCPNGSAWELRARHRAEQTLFSELTLWLHFECMIDAISVLEYGAEFYEDVDGEQTMKPPSEEWNGVVHFDFQIDNIFVAGRDRRHTSTPVFKLGDFGFAEYIDSTDESPDALLFNQSLRGRGTPGYLPPEQFTDRWDYTDWQSSGIAGIFGPWSMIWSAAAIMYQFATLSDTPPSAGTPFFPTFHLNNAPPLGWTYGHDLQAYAFSTTLKDLLFECLYEIPSHRPDLLNLKTRIAAAITATLASDKALINPWDDFIPDDPIDHPPPQGGSPSPPPPPPPPLAPPHHPAFPAGLAVPMPLLPPPALFPARQVKVTYKSIERNNPKNEVVK
ncbi:kinase-like domain-containing protein [Leptodontidium sp. 2 PMI_412]|nr:kinase-like domain-containing protein [Leptodontidium sp. 2 PMI_412]